MKVSAEQVWFVTSFFSPQWAYKYSSLTIGIRKKEKNALKSIKENFIYLFIYLLIYVFTLAPLEML